ncbi:Helix-turn-helix domain-containing protein [Bacillus sp. 71mf]|nr:Helix-turn-helix domain-containing protein [Bacillus sp. 71mf]SFS96955.1 Helix-turn-helix domain-containing protein [Bacillus sp. 103mf]
MNEQGTSIRETAALFNIPSCKTFRKWKVVYETGGLDTLQSKKKGRPSMEKKKTSTTKGQSVVEGSIEALQAEKERLHLMGVPPHRYQAKKIQLPPERDFVLTCNKKALFSFWGEFVFLS